MKTLKLMGNKNFGGARRGESRPGLAWHGGTGLGLARRGMTGCQ